jgi:hypothetical protein
MIGVIARKLFGSSMSGEQGYLPRVVINALEKNWRVCRRAAGAHGDVQAAVAEGTSLTTSWCRPACLAGRRSGRWGNGTSTSAHRRMILHEGRIAEMKTGEGKTGGDASSHLNALGGRGCTW